MNPQKTKILVKNVAVGVGIIGVLIVAYIMFVKKNDVPTGEFSVDVTSTETVTTPYVVEAKVMRTVRELSELNRAVASTIAIFRTPIFQSLENFSVVVPEEPVGSKNPFVATEWKLKLKAFEEQAKNN